MAFKPKPFRELLEEAMLRPLVERSSDTAKCLRMTGMVVEYVRIMNDNSLVRVNVTDLVIKDWPYTVRSRPPHVFADGSEAFQPRELDIKA